MGGKEGAEELRRAGADADETLGDAPAAEPVQPCPGGGLEIVDASTGKVVSGAPTTVVGKKMKLLARSCPAGGSLTNLGWEIDQETVKSYTVSEMKAVRVDLGRADLRSTEVSFYWISPGTKTVTVSASVNGGPSASATVAFDVLAPTGVSLTSNTHSVLLEKILDPPTPYLYEGTNDRPMPKGVEWTLKATTPGGVGGYYGMFVLINIANLLQAPDRLVRANSKGRYVCAGEVPFSAVGYPRTRMAIAGMSTTMGGEILRGQNLTADYDAVTVIEHLRLFFMFNPAAFMSDPRDDLPAEKEPPDGTPVQYRKTQAGKPAAQQSDDTIWVALGRLDWWWSAGATRSGTPGTNVWTGPIGPKSDTNPAGAPTTDLPTWEDNVATILQAMAADQEDHPRGTYL
jgi:hypothetical protein